MDSSQAPEDAFFFDTKPERPVPGVSVDIAGKDPSKSIYADAMAVTLTGRHVFDGKKGAEISIREVVFSQLHDIVTRARRLRTIFLAADLEGKGPATTELGIFARVIDPADEGHAAHYIFGEPGKSAKPCEFCTTRRLESPDQVRDVWHQTLNHYFQQCDVLVLVGHAFTGDIHNLWEFCGAYIPAPPAGKTLTILDTQHMFIQTRAHKEQTSLGDCLKAYRAPNPKEQYHNATNDAKFTIDLLWLEINDAMVRYGEHDWNQQDTALKTLQPFSFNGGRVVNPVWEYVATTAHTRAGPSEGQVEVTDSPDQGLGDSTEKAEVNETAERTSVKRKPSTRGENGEYIHPPKKQNTGKDQSATPKQNTGRTDLDINKITKKSVTRAVDLLRREGYVVKAQRLEAVLAAWHEDDAGEQLA